MKKLFVIMGAPGTGKTSIANHRPHKELSKVLSEVDGMMSLGGWNGGDRLQNVGVPKPILYAETMPLLMEHDVLSHSWYHQSPEDLHNFSKTHDIVVICLYAPYEVICERLQARAKNDHGGKQKSRLFLYTAFNRLSTRVKLYCARRKFPFYEVDANRILSDVAKEVWSIIDKERGRV